MAISAQCPFCKKAYKFKDEYTGKRVKCAAAECRQVFDVVPLPKVDAEALALAALTENPDPVAAIPEEKRKIKITCVSCDHVWEEGWDKQGKNVLCPECRHRQKVPEQKTAGNKVDWRDPTKDRPTLAKREEVPDDVWGSSKSNVSVETLKKAGAIAEPEIEPRPLSFWIKSGLALFALILALGGGYWYVFVRGKEAGELDKLMKEAMNSAGGMKDSGLAPPTAAVAEGLLRTADAEYQVRWKKAERLKVALEQFAAGRQALDGAPKGIERDAGLAEWLVAVTSLGGDEEQVKGRTKVGWEPAGSQARAQVNVKIYLVVEELQAGFAALQKASEFDTRVLSFRRLTTTLADNKQTKLLPALIGQGFVGEDEQREVQGYLGLDLLRLGEEQAARDLATELDGAIEADAKAGAPGSVRALWHVTQVKPLSTIPPGNVEIKTRFALALAKAAEKNGDGAVKEALRPGSQTDQFRTLAACAESMDDPAIVVAKAYEVFQTVRNNKDVVGGVNVATWARLARAAAKAGNDDAAKGFVTAPLSDEGKGYVLAEMIRGKLASLAGQKADPAWVELPDDPKKIKAGHLIARMMIARHNGKTGDTGLAKSFDNWPKDSVRPFGLAGLVLGLQDKNNP